MKHRFDMISRQKVLVIAGSVLVYSVVLVLLLWGIRREEQQMQTVHGSMETRFQSDIVMQYDGSSWYYRENEITNYLIIGLDRESFGHTAGHQNGAQADFLVVLSIDRVNRRITPVMLDRDTMTEVQIYDVSGNPSGKSVMQLCLAQGYSGIDTTGSRNTVNAVEDLLYGVKIDHYVTVDASAIPLLHDTIGDIEVTLAETFHVLSMLHGKMETDSDLPVKMRNILSGHVQSDTENEILLQDVYACSRYEWKPMYFLQGSRVLDENSFAEFHVDDDYLRKLVTDLWFIQEEQK